MAIFDASNGSIERRRKQKEIVSDHAEAVGQPISTVFVELILESPNLLLANMQAKVSGDSIWTPCVRSHASRAVADTAPSSEHPPSILRPPPPCGASQKTQKLLRSGTAL